MKSLEFSAKTVEDAVQMALVEMKLNRDEVDIEIIEHPNKGFFGIIGSKKATVKVIEKFNSHKKIKEILKNIFINMDIEPQIDINDTNDNICVNLTGNDLGILIGHRGDTLDSIQFLLNLIINKHTAERVKIVLDVEGYRKRREKTLVNLAYRLAKKASRTGKKVILEPMNPHERRIIHVALQEERYVSTFSEGEDPYRKVVIVPKR